MPAQFASDFYSEQLNETFSDHVMQGASAAVNAIILLDVFLFPKKIIYLNLIIPVPAILMVSSSSLGKIIIML